MFNYIKNRSNLVYSGAPKTVPGYLSVPAPGRKSTYLSQGRMENLHAGILAGFWIVGYRYPERLSSAAPDEGWRVRFPLPHRIWKIRCLRSDPFKAAVLRGVCFPILSAPFCRIARYYIGDVSGHRPSGARRAEISAMRAWWRWRSARYRRLFSPIGSGVKEIS